MKYKKIYEVLEQRRSSSPDFRYIFATKVYGS